MKKRNKPKKTFVINKARCKPLSKASHKVGINGREVSDTNPSEWAMSFALSPYKDGQVVPLKELCDAIQNAIIQEAIEELISNGILYQSYDEKKQDFVYGFTEHGKEYVDNLPISES